MLTGCRFINHCFNLSKSIAKTWFYVSTPVLRLLELLCLCIIIINDLLAPDALRTRLLIRGAHKPLCIDITEGFLWRWHVVVVQVVFVIDHCGFSGACCVHSGLDKTCSVMGVLVSTALPAWLGCQHVLLIHRLVDLSLINLNCIFYPLI